MAEKKDKGLLPKIISWLFIIVVLAAVGVFAYKQLNKPPSDPVKKEQLTLEGGLKIYGKIAHQFLHQQATFDELRKVIPQDDWDWFQNNYNNLFQDAFDVKSGIHPVEGEALARFSVMQRVLSYGPHREDCRIMEKNISGNHADLVVRQLIDYGNHEDIPIEMFKDGKYWKVRHFGGGRQSVMGEPIPGGRKKFIKKGTEGAQAGVVRPPTSSGPAPQQPPPQPAAPQGPLAEPLAGQMAPQPSQQESPEVMVDRLIKEAGELWQAKQFNESLKKAKEALALCKEHLGENHPKTQKVQKMVDVANRNLHP